MMTDEELSRVPTEVLGYIVKNMRLLEESWTRLANEHDRRQGAVRPAPPRTHVPK